MDNYEKYADKIEIIIRTGENIAKSGDVIASCVVIGCDDCDFGERHACTKNRREWMNAEYKEPFVLNLQEYCLCMAIGRGYLTRNKIGDLFWHKEYPLKGESGWKSGGRLGYLNPELFSEAKFKFIHWEDKEPYSVEDLIEQYHEAMAEAKCSLAKANENIIYTVGEEKREMKDK